MVAASSMYGSNRQKSIGNNAIQTDACAVLVIPKAQESWEILFLTLQELLTQRCREAGIPAIFTVLKNEPFSSALLDELKEYKQVLVLEGNQVYITAEDIVTSYAVHGQSRTPITMWQERESKEFSNTAWYDAEYLWQEDKMEELRQTLKNPPSGFQVASAQVGCLATVTTRGELAKATQQLREETIFYHLEQGVNIPVSDGVMISPGVVIGADTTILPGCSIKGNTSIGKNCEIGPNTQLTDVKISDGCTVVSSFLDKSVLEDNVRIGPMANIRPDCYIEAGAKIGDFVELKNARIGSRTSVSHLSYLGDCKVGSDCNFGSGATIVNYDGTTKHKTTIGNGVFIGCNCSMVSPLVIGDGAYAAAGSTITEDVPADALVIARARQTIKEDWSKQRGLYRK